MGILSSSIWVLYQGWFFLAAMERKNITNLFCFECSHYIVHTFFPWRTETLQRAWNVWKVNSQNITRRCGYYDSHLGYIGGRWLLSPLYHASCLQVVLQVSRERLSEKIRTRQSQKVIGIWSIHCSWHCSCQTYVCCFFSALVNICPWPLVSFSQNSLMNSELKATHNTFRDCLVHFLRQPFSK